MIILGLCYYHIMIILRLHDDHHKKWVERLYLHFTAFNKRPKIGEAANRLLQVAEKLYQYVNPSVIFQTLFGERHSHCQIICRV